MFAESGAFRVRPHRHPAWKIVLALGGGVEVGYGGNRTVAAVGVIVPPQLAHTCAVSSAYVALFLDPWELALGTGPTRLNETATHRVLAALDHPGPGADLDAARAELATLAGAGTPLDSRVAHAVRRSPAPGPPPRSARSPPRSGSPSRGCAPSSATGWVSRSRGYACGPCCAPP